MEKNKPFDYENSETKKFLLHLCSGSESAYGWVVNWLVGVAQEIGRSEAVLCLYGAQGSGKSLFYEMVIKNLIPAEKTICVDEPSITEVRPWIDDVQFYCLNEVELNRENRSSFESVVSPDLFFIEEERQKIGNALITCNAKPDYKRNISFVKTGESLRKAGWDTALLLENLKREQPFVKDYFKGLEVEFEQYNRVFSEPLRMVDNF